LEISSYFKERRGYGLHEGIDIIGSKKDEVKSLLQGTAERTGLDHTGYGNFVVISHNTKYFFKNAPFRENFFTLYGHLRTIDPSVVEKSTKKEPVNKFININDNIGYFGNTGSCWTSYAKDGSKSGKLRPVTILEQNDVDCNFGVHLHFSIFSERKETKLTGWLIEKGILDKTDVLSWNFRYYYDPLKLLDYFKKEFGA